MHVNFEGLYWWILSTHGYYSNNSISYSTHALDQITFYVIRSKTIETGDWRYNLASEAQNKRGLRWNFVYDSNIYYIYCLKFIKVPKMKAANIKITVKWESKFLVLNMKIDSTNWHHDLQVDSVRRENCFIITWKHVKFKYL